MIHGFAETNGLNFTRTISFFSHGNVREAESGKTLSVECYFSKSAWKSTPDCGDLYHSYIIYCNVYETPELAYKN